MDDLWWAEKYHWTPDVVDALPAGRAARLRFAADAVDEGQQKRSEEEARAVSRTA